MAFSLRNLSVLAYASGFTLWLYKAGSEEHADVTRPDFFEEVGDMLAVGDMVLVAAREGGRMLCVLAEGAGLRVAPMLL
jgi:hypothetical protein